MIVNLEFVRAIVTAEEVLLLDPLGQEVLPFVDQLRRQLSQRSPLKQQVADQMISQDNELQSPSAGQRLPAADSLQHQLSFEFHVLEMALECVCMHLDSSVAELERDACPALDELAINFSTKNLEHVRSLKSNLTHWLARVLKVRGEIKHLLDGNEDMVRLCLTRKLLQSQQAEALSVTPASSHLRQIRSNRSSNSVSYYQNEQDVEKLEMLLEAYLMQLDGTRNKTLSVQQCIDDTEEHVKMQLDNQRNGLMELKLKIAIGSFALMFENLAAGVFGMNIPFTWKYVEGIFGEVVGIMTVVTSVVFVVIWEYARWNKLIAY